MAKRRKEPPTAQELHEKALKELERWKEIKANGAGDPGWPDGVNLELVRNHIISYNRQILEVSKGQMQMSLLGEPVFYGTNPLCVPLPPVVDRNYMAQKASILANAKKVLKQMESGKIKFEQRDREILSEALRKGDYVVMRRYRGRYV